MSDFLFASSLISLAVCVVCLVLFERWMDRLQISIIGLGSVASLFHVPWLPTICLVAVLILWFADWRLQVRKAERADLEHRTDLDTGCAVTASDAHARRRLAQAKILAAERSGDWSDVSDADHVWAGQRK